jgi:hypothetical protein
MNLLILKPQDHLDQLPITFGLKEIGDGTIKPVLTYVKMAAGKHLTEVKITLQDIGINQLVDTNGKKDIDKIYYLNYILNPLLIVVDFLLNYIPKQLVFSNFISSNDRVMKKLIPTIIFIALLMSCSSSKNSLSKSTTADPKKTDTIRIANDLLEYEVIIIDSGFNTWLNSQAKPRGFYTEEYLEERNQIYAAEWNNRAMQPQKYNSELYEMQINYKYNIHYGYEVNYLIYNYFIYFQITNKQPLSGFVPRP